MVTEATVRSVATALSPALRRALKLPSAAAAYERGELSQRVMQQLHDRKLWIKRCGDDGYGYYETELGRDVTAYLRSI